jgi:dipeptidyl aminopeptidase/acylaminoacyl peptidase
MKIPQLCILLVLFSLSAFSQKKPLDHTVYDNWQSIGEKMISNDGKWVVYTINPQEGDNDLVIQSADNQYKKIIPRGYNATITEDSRFVVFKIKAFFKDIRQARIRKKKPEDFPKDSLAIMELGKESVWKKAQVKSYQTPAEGFGWIAYQMEKPQADSAKSKKNPTTNNQSIDSLQKLVDSLRYANSQLLEKKKQKNRDEEFDNTDFADEDPASSTTDAGSDLILRKNNGDEKVFRNVQTYNFNKTGRKLLIVFAKQPKDSLSRNMVVMYDLVRKTADTVSRGGNDFRNFAMTDDGMKLAFLAERDSSAKAVQKFYKLWYYKDGMDSAVMLVDRCTTGMMLGNTVSENGQPYFSKNGQRIFFGTAPILPPKDTSLADIDKVSVDIWNYKDDYLQTAQLNRLQVELKRNYLAEYDLAEKKLFQLASEQLPSVFPAADGDADMAVGITDYGMRVSSQWTGNTNKDIYTINLHTGEKKLVKKNLDGVIQPQWVSPTGKYMLWYDNTAKNYFVYDGLTTRNITSGIHLPLYNEENDMPDNAPPYGIMKWQENDAAVFVYDRYGVWKVNPVTGSALLLIDNRKNKTQFRYVQVDKDEKFIRPGQRLVFRSFNENTKQSGFWENSYDENLNYLDGWAAVNDNENVSIGQVQKAKYKPVYLFTKESYRHSPDLYVRAISGIKSSYTDMNSLIVNPPMPVEPSPAVQLSSINPQQSMYNWGTSELFKWKAYNGKESMGIIYKPEDFDPAKKYPMICYFYETLSDGLNNYNPPSPTPSRLNISFFVSRGYIVFAPDIHYGTGHPGRDAYNYILSGARAIVKKGWVDSTRVGLQGQSWGGYQVAYLITATNFFKAAWAGAPVANMTSAYGGIRWESGVNRQFQYEKSQSRIGATLWEKPQLYIENSPLFHLPNVKTPLVIMSNDADGAVPWYQGIEMFTAMRRLGKQVWLLDYNGEAHNLVERKNRKDISVREQQYFDWMLKGDKPPKWITEGVPAVKKGRDWGLQIID